MKNLLPTVYIPNEIKVRELDGKLLLTSYLIDKNFKVKIGARAGIKREILATKNGIYIAKSLTKDEISFYKKLKALGHRIAILHSEGSVLLEDIKQELLSCYPKECTKFIDLFFVSGLEIKNKMKEYTSYIEHQKIVVVGDPRFDLYKPKYFIFWQNSVDNILDKYKNFILVNTNFGTGNAKIGNNALKKYILDNPDYSEEFKKVRILKQKFINLVMLDFIKAVKHLASQNKNLNIILRPHPSESDKIYLNEFKKYKNVHVVYKGHVAPWIIASKAVIHYDCTTGVEALLSGRKPISYLSKTDKNLNAWLPILISKKANNIDELTNLVGNIDKCNKYKLSTKNEEILIRYMFNYNNSSSKIIVNKLLELSSKIDILKTDNFSLVLFLKRFQTGLRFYREKIIKNSKKNRLISQIKFSFISKNEVKRKILLLNQLNGFVGSYKFKNIGKDVVSINK